VEWRLSSANCRTKAPAKREIAHTPLKRNSLKLIVRATAKGTANASGNAHLLVSLMLSTVTREQYIERSKESALALLRGGRIREAVAQMMMDMRKHPNCEVPHEIHAFGISAVGAGDATLARAYIEGFN
jgi:hypothetical protein